MKRLWLVSLGCAASLLSAAQFGCSSEQSSAGASGGARMGGATSSGGSSGTGAVSSSGGTSASGGAATGGSGGANVSAGGTPASGGSAAGGVGGSGGGVSSGGASGTGATSPVSGGATTTGGTTAAGGATTAAGGGTTAAGGSMDGGSGGATGDGGTTPAAGSTGDGGDAGACTSGDCATPDVITYPTPPGAEESPLYTVAVNDTPLFVEKMAKYSPEMQVHYAHGSLAGTEAATVSVTVNESFNSYTLSPKSRNTPATKNGNTLTFSSGPNYWILAVDSKELLFILLDAEEMDPPRLGDANVKNIADYDVDDTGATLVTSKVQSAIDAASGATQNILYFPPGKYTVGEIWLRSDMTLYLAGGALLYGSDSTGDFETGSGGVDIEGCSHGMIRMYQISNTKVLGRGVIDANGKAIRAQNDTKLNLFKIEESSDILIDGILVRDPSFWNTLVYRSDNVTIQDYKMVNCRPTTGDKEYNNTDGVNFDESTNGTLYNAFLYTGDDSMATKNEFDTAGAIDTRDILHEKVVCYSNSVGCKIGTKTMGQTMDGIVFRDIDIVKAGRALNIDAYDTAVVQNTKFENIRIEAADTSIIALEEADPPSWRDAKNQSIIKDTYFTNVSADVRKVINMHGRSAEYNITGVHFSNFTVQGNPITSATDADATWDINSFVSNITFE